MSEALGQLDAVSALDLTLRERSLQLRLGSLRCERLCSAVLRSRLRCALGDPLRLAVVLSRLWAPDSFQVSLSDRGIPVGSLRSRRRCRSMKLSGFWRHADDAVSAGRVVVTRAKRVELRDEPDLFLTRDTVRLYPRHQDFVRPAANAVLADRAVEVTVRALLRRVVDVLRPALVHRLMSVTNVALPSD